MFPKHNLEKCQFLQCIRLAMHHLIIENEYYVENFQIWTKEESDKIGDTFNCALFDSITYSYDQSSDTISLQVQELSY